MHGEGRLTRRWLLPVVFAMGMIGPAVAWAAVVGSTPGTSSGTGAAPASAPSRLTREALVGAWRLLRIEFTLNGRAAPDPFYPGDSTGLIVYSATGWMSAQIVSPQPPAWPVPDSRTPAQAGDHAELKAAGFDSYYAYFGTWELNAAKSTVIHHVKGSLMPAEIGADYSQEVTLVGDRLTFTGRSVHEGIETVRTKVWQRAWTTSPIH